MAKREMIPIDSPKKQARRRENQAVGVRLRADGGPWTYHPPRAKKVLEEVPVVSVERPKLLVDVPTDPALQNNLASDLLAWSNTDEAEAIEQFPLSLKMNPYKFYRVADINPYFSDCLEAATAAIGFRRERNARTRKEDGATIMKMQPLYNRAYRDLALQKSNAESTKVGTIIQVIEGKVPDSEMVPIRLAKEIE